MLPLDSKESKVTVFIIHGRDSGPVKDLSSFLYSLEIDVITVEQLDSESASPLTIQKIVSSGIKKADVVIALFTPDEAVALYDPSTGELVDGETGWQARPNVIFEVGLAFVIADKKLILATLGSLRRISDLDGIYQLRLDDEDAKLRMARKLASILGRSAPPTADPRLIGGFDALKRSRWTYHDEVDLMKRRMSEISLERPSTNLLRIVKKTILQRKNLGADWSIRGSSKSTAQRFMKAIKEIAPNHVNDAYWWLSVLGFFEFQSISQWWDDENWASACKYSDISKRGFSLIERIKEPLKIGAALRSIVEKSPKKSSARPPKKKPTLRERAF